MERRVTVEVTLSLGEYNVLVCALYETMDRWAERDMMLGQVRDVKAILTKLGYDPEVE